jgi:hypothetical protein
MPPLTAEARLAWVIRGVVEQAIRDAGAIGIRLAEPESAASRLIERWCGTTFSAAGSALGVSALNKTELLLAGVREHADLYPLGDLYASELAAFTAEAAVSGPVAELAAAAGGLAQLDAGLRRLLDERRTADAAFAGMVHVREMVLTRLHATRFGRTRAGIIPKLGARTIGIDLFI